MTLTIKSRNYKSEVTFSRPGMSYIYIDLTGRNPGTLGNQICKGGFMAGDTLEYYGDDQEEFEAICRRWWRMHLRKAGW